MTAPRDGPKSKNRRASWAMITLSMTLLARLQANKGTVSSALGKQLALEVLGGNKKLLADAVKLIHFDSKNVRSGAAKLIEKVAEGNPKLVARHLPKLRPALEYEEAQTRWMMVHTFGLCAHLDPDAARGIFKEATGYLDPSHGTVLRDRAITYLGYMGAVSRKDCNKCFPRLIESFDLHPDRVPRVLESLERMVGVMSAKQKAEATAYASEYAEHAKPSLKSRGKRLLKALAKV